MELNKNEEYIIDKIEAHRDDIVQSLRELIKVKSLTGEEGEIQQKMQRYFKQMGLSVDVWEPDIKELFDKFPQIAQYPSSWQKELDLPLRFEDVCTYEQLVKSGYIERLNYKGRPNVVGTLKGKNGGRSLILNGHIDVVTVEPVDKWKHNPWSADMEGNLIYGRGACDMKGGVVAMTKAVEYLLETGIELGGDVIIQTVVNEEHSGNGTLSCIARGYTADAAIVTEPSQCKIASESGGGVYWEIIIEGREVHTGTRWRDGELYGISANEKVPIIINSLIELEKEFNKKGVCCSMGIGKLQGGSYATSTAKECIISGVCYFTPELGIGINGIKKVKERIKEIVIDAAASDEWLSKKQPKVYFLHYDDAYRYDSEIGICELLQESGKDVLNKDVDKINLSACDSRHLGNQAGIPTILYGPGDMSKAHSTDEYIDVNELIEATKILAITIYRWCA